MPSPHGGRIGHCLFVFLVGEAFHGQEVVRGKPAL
jgi:hypothetical protein